jgi:hypothetical protein
MIGLLFLGVLVTLAAAGLAVIVGLALAIKLLVRLILLPLLLLKLVLTGVLFFIVGPVVLAATFVAMIAVGAAVTIPLLPLLAIALLIWAIVKGNRRPVLVR